VGVFKDNTKITEAQEFYLTEKRVERFNKSQSNIFALFHEGESVTLVGNLHKGSDVKF
jgi:hypothetical protein